VQKEIIKLYDKHHNVFVEIKYNLETFKHFAKHSHNTFNISIIEDEEIGIWYHNSSTQILDTKSIAIYNPNQIHVTQNRGFKPIPYINFHFQVDWCLNIQKTIFGHIDSLLPVYPFVIHDNKLRDRLISINKNIGQDNFLIEDTLKNILTELFQNYAQQENSRSSHALIKKIENYIKAHLNQKIDIEKMALEIGYSSAYINRVFKQHYGLAPHAFIVDKRIQKAKELILTNPKLSLTDIAYEAGFYDQSHFIKRFKKAYSLSPNNYKSSG